jgi:hypothetical protein
VFKNSKRSRFSSFSWGKLLKNGQKSNLVTPFERDQAPFEDLLPLQISDQALSCDTVCSPGPRPSFVIALFLTVNGFAPEMQGFSTGQALAAR